jgi:hypothetical protein
MWSVYHVENEVWFLYLCWRGSCTTGEFIVFLVITVWSVCHERTWLLWTLLCGLCTTWRIKFGFFIFVGVVRVPRENFLCVFVIADVVSVPQKLCFVLKFCLWGPACPVIYIYISSCYVVGEPRPRRDVCGCSSVSTSSRITWLAKYFEVALYYGTSELMLLYRKYLNCQLYALLFLRTVFVLSNLICSPQITLVTRVDRPNGAIALFSVTPGCSSFVLLRNGIAGCISTVEIWQFST